MLMFMTLTFLSISIISNLNCPAGRAKGRYFERKVIMKIRSLEDLCDALKQLRCELYFLSDDDDAINEFSDLLDDAEDIVREIQKKQEA